ncbi:adenosine deaminase 2 isoform X2 [Eupeodes corollae]|uniref:adenosine deaminase 2 isoform X2 n=1 Tax=Eupeodes corollae TaxID=290404 RepID=UPI0024928B31|nr:adenosine deaminase 2 isoform X2 [Eupeodes corollae]
MSRIILFIAYVVAINLLLSCSRLVQTLELSYDSVREKIMEAERLSATGGNLWLSPKEEKANSILMNAKRQEIAEGLKKPDMYPPGMHFFHAKPLIRQSEVFRIIQKMPKGAFLHGHNKGIVSSKWVIKNLTSQYNVYTCRDERGVMLFTFRNTSRCSSELKNVCVERLNTDDRRQYDRQLEKHVNMYTMHPESLITENQKIWRRFEDVFDSIDNFYRYLPVFRAYHRRMMEELYEDNIIYAEIRASLSELYGDKNKTYDALEVADELEKVVNEYKDSNPDFVGMKVIYAKKNKGTVDDMTERIVRFKELHSAKPNFIIGFDLVGQEDLGDPLHKFVTELSDIPTGAHFFFHAGETKWYGKTDWNLMDAILLNTRRIGHGFALSKHPQLWDTVKNRGIAIEVNPISNQVLGLVWDLRNHPASFFIAEDIPIIISADDPGIWNAKGLSYDFYYAFMSFAPVDADLRILKQFALNSIKYSVLNGDERRKINKVFRRKWDEFIDDVTNLRF